MVLEGVRLVNSPNLSLYAVFPVITFFWLTVAVLGIIVPCFFWRYKHRLTLQVAIVTTAICCYTFWLLAFLAQLNPLVGPQMELPVAAHIRKVWKYSDVPSGPSECFPVY